MAVERYDNLTLDDLKALIDGLGWFAASDVETGTYTWYADEQKQKSVLRITSSQIRFSSTGNVDAAFISANFGGMGAPMYALKTVNGLLLSNTTFYAQSQWFPWAGILGKTNNGAIAAAINSEFSANDVGKISTSAYGETVKGLETLVFRGGYQYPAQRQQTCQITCIPIPTCPSNGTSYIKGASALVVAPWDYYWGEVDINGVRYSTNGYLALSDDE